MDLLGAHEIRLLLGDISRQRAARSAEQSWADLHDEVFTRPRHVPPQL